MNKEIKIVAAQSGDVQSVVKIFSDARAGMAYLPLIHTPEEVQEYITSLVISGKIHIVKENGVIIGFMEAGDGWIQHLYIAPQFHGKGFGKLLLDKAKALHPRGLKLWVFEENTKAIKFYEREGFIVAEKRNKEETTNEENLPDRKYTWNGKSISSGE